MATRKKKVETDSDDLSNRDGLTVVDDFVEVSRDIDEISEALPELVSEPTVEEPESDPYDFSVFEDGYTEPTSEVSTSLEDVKEEESPAKEKSRPVRIPRIEKVRKPKRKLRFTPY